MKDEPTTVVVEGFGEVTVTAAQVDEFERFGSDAWVWKSRLGEAIQKALGHG